MHVGKEIRLRRFIDDNNKTIIMPLDHGVEGVFDRIAKMDKCIEELAEKSDAFILRRGSVRNAYKSLINKSSIILRVSCTTAIKKQPMPTYESFVATLESAIRLGADAVIATVWFGTTKENECIKAFGELADLCDRYGMPLIGESLICQDSGLDPKDEKANIIAARTLAEEGADIVKVLYTGSVESFDKVINYSLVPVVTAGGDTKGTDMDFLKDVEDMMKAGAIGTSIGRNIWNRSNYIDILNAVDGIVKKGMTAKEAYETFCKK